MPDPAAGNHPRVAVVGGGLVGATAALLLQQQGFPVTLIDRRRPQLNKGRLGLDIRNVALSPASRALLERAGIWPCTGVAPYYRMCIWEQWGTGVVHFDAAEAGVPALGWLLEMSPLLVGAWQRMQDTSEIELVEGNIADVLPGDSTVTVSMDHATRSFDFLIAADGAQSVVRKALGLDVVQQSLDQVAIATVVRTANPHEHTAWQRFGTEGPLALLPGPDEHLCSVVWSQTEASAQRRVHLEDDAFRHEIGLACEYCLGEVEAVDARFSFALSQQRVRRCAPHPRVLLIGDAMRVVHPLAGQGVNLGLEDVAALLRVAEQHRDLAASGIWRRFARQRQMRSRMMMQVMSSLQKIYTNPHPAMTLLRNVGVQSFDALPGLKRQVMREAMGLTHL